MKVTALSQEDASERPDFPLSAAQTRIWLGQMLAPDQSWYNVAGYIDIAGRIDPPRMAEAVRQVTSDIESLRLVFLQTSRGPEQRVMPAIDCSMHYLDVSGEADPHEAALVWMRLDMTRQLDLRERSLRHALLKLGAERFIHYCVGHHLITDGFAAVLTEQHLAKLYSWLVRGDPRPIQAPASALDLLAEETLYRASAKLQLDRSFWLTELRDRPEPCTLSGRPPAWGGQQIQSVGRLARVHAEAVQSLGKSHGAGLAAVIMAAVAIYLARLTGTRDLILGVPVANRPTQKLRGIAGLAANILPVRLPVDLGLPFTAILREAARRLRHALRHQRYDAGALRQDLGLSPDQPDIYGTLVNLIPVESPLDFAGAPARMFHLENGRVGDLMLTVYLGGAACDLQFVVSANAANYTPDGLKRHRDGLLHLLQDATASPDKQAAALSLMSDEIRQNLLPPVQAAERLPRAVTFPALFEERASRTPDGLAILAGERRLSYRELNRRANLLAHHLIGLGIGPGSLVGLSIDRTPETIAALLAILKAGGAYLPLDLAMPAARLARIIEDARPVLILANPVDAMRLPAGRPHQPTDLPDDDSKADITNPSDMHRCCELRVEHAAYVIFTSGSTGAPKGVVVTHGGIAALASSHVAHFAVSPGSRVLQFASLSFDASVAELATAWGAGAALVLLPPEALSGPPLSHFIATTGVTHATLPPSVLATLAPGTLPLECLAVAGETCPQDLAAAWSGANRMFNAYGPTETTVCTTLSANFDGASAPIGRPIDGSRIYVLDAALEPVPDAIVGEIYIAGQGLARGYLNQPGLTASRFPPDPYGPPGSRMYRTGDLGCWRPDGQLDFLGRADRQVKIRGMRVEPEEIETVLRGLPEIAQAAIVAREDQPGEITLAAYLVAAEDCAIDPSNLRGRLAGRLPPHMIPTAFVALDSMPLNASGKLDRSALKRPERRALATDRYEPPQGAREIEVAAIWQDLLGIERVGRNDNFFGLGGHSLKLIGLAARLRQRGWAADLAAFFAHPTPAALAAALIEDLESSRVPPNRLDPGCTKITPDLLPLVAIDQPAIDRIVASLPGGAGNLQDIYPLSPLQEGMVFHHRLSAGRDVYVLSVLLAVTSAENLDRLVAAMQAVIDRHDSLRTAIQWEGLAEPVQVVWRRATLPVEEIVSGGEDLSTVLWRAAKASAPIDLRRAPLLRVFVAQASRRQEWGLLLQLHHAIADHVTIERIGEELRAHLAGFGASLPPAQPIRGVVVQSRRAMQSPSHKTFFCTRLGDINAPTAPFGMLELAGDDAAVEETRVTLPHGLATALRAEANRLEVTPATLFHAAWAMVLACTTGREDIVFGTVLLGRLHGAVVAGNALGLLVNTLPLRLSLQGRTVEQAVRDVQACLAELLLHEQASLAMAQACSGLAPPRPLFTTLLNYRHSQSDGAVAGLQSVGGVRILRVEERSHYPFMLSVEELASGFELAAQAPRKIGSSRMAAFMQTALERLTEALIKTPRAAWAGLDALPDEERNMLLLGGAATEAKLPSETVAGLFAMQAARTPNAVALICGAARLTYGKLDAAANRLGRYLAAQDIGRDTVVAIALPRSAELVIAVLAVLKSGAAYLPLDPAYPSLRLSYMLRDSNAAMLISTLPALTGLAVPEADRPPALLLDDPMLHARLDALPDHSLDSTELAEPPCWESLAFVIYTSGSTGNAKGVGNTQAGLVNRLAWQWHAMPYGDDEVVCLKTSPNFVDSVTEMLAPLLRGVKLVVASPTEGADPVALATLIAAQKVTRLTVVPSLLHVLLDSPDDLATLRLCVCSGEVLTAELAGRFHGALPQARLWNFYGASEASGDSVVCQVQPHDLAAGSSPAIGRPIWNTRAYVLDAALKPVPIEVTGELYITGSGLARGYLGRPAFTAERFVACPFGPEGSRMYRTGDLARWTQEGILKYAGRIDRQMKIRGMRIEPGEIEAVLRGYREIAEACVQAFERGGDSRLVAFLVASPGCKLPPAWILHERLREALPTAMFPSAFVELASLPLTPNGKLDRHALKPPDQLENAPDQAAIAEPLSPMEERVAAIWREILHAGEISRFDDFFELGGHSLAATRVAARLREGLGLELPLAVLFACRTLRALASRIEQAIEDPETAFPASPPLRPSALPGPVPLSPSQERMWLIQSLAPASTAYNIVAAMTVCGPLNVEFLAEAIGTVSARHDVLHSVIRLVDGQPMQLIEPAAAPRLEFADLRDSGAKAQQLALALAEQYAFSPFDLASGPMLRARLYCLADDRFLLLLVLHHVAGDQWSLGILGREIAAVYNSRMRGCPARLEALPITYRDYALWQRERMRGPGLEQQAAFWRHQLADLPTLDLPTDRPFAAVPGLDGAVYRLPIPPMLIVRIEELGRSLGSTIFMSMLAAFVALLHRLTGQTDIPIGVPVANRNQSTTEKLIGTFVNTLVIRTNLAGNPPFETLVQRVRETTLDALAHQDVPFDWLVREMAQRREANRGALVQAMFDVNNAPMHDIRFDGLDWQVVPLDRRHPQFELSVAVDTEVTRTVTFEYSNELFERGTIENLAKAYFTLLDAACGMPTASIHALTLLSQADREALRSWNATAAPPPEAATFVTLFQDQVARSPHATAISCQDETLSYSELDTRSDAIAHILRAHGVGPGVLVGLCVPRTLTLPTALIAIQKSGAAYVPLDPDYPLERLDFMLADSSAKLVVTAGNCAGRVGRSASVPVLDLDHLDETMAAHPAASPADHSSRIETQQDIAYVIYTSGSTGRPKGVAVSHGALLNFLLSIQECGVLDETDVLAAVTTISFDIAALELYLPLMRGARVELVPKEIATDGVKFAGLLEERSVTILQATPATWHMLLEAKWQGRPGFRVLCGGEALTRELAESLLDRAEQVWNLYGPTETTVWSSMERIERGRPISIGRPIRNTQIHILGAHGEDMPIGAAGEICIGGAGVALGYINQAGLTAERFVADPHATEPGARLYRTGDIGLWSAEGRLFHLGRRDQQVKIRGNRIETGEIESVLAAHPAVRQALVLAREAQPGDMRLVAYLLYFNGEDLTASEVRRYLRKSLPEFMIPSVVMALASFPLTPNNKVDRRGLPEPFKASQRALARRELPSPGTEQILAKIWSSVLGVDQVFADDNFFEIGGHSLLALRTAAAVERETGRRLDPRALFFHSLRQVAAMADPGASGSISAVQ